MSLLDVFNDNDIELPDDKVFRKFCDYIKLNEEQYGFNELGDRRYYTGAKFDGEHHNGYFNIQSCEFYNKKNHINYYKKYGTEYKIDIYMKPNIKFFDCIINNFMKIDCAEFTANTLIEDKINKYTISIFDGDIDINISIVEEQITEDNYLFSDIVKEYCNMKKVNIIELQKEIEKLKIEIKALKTLPGSDLYKQSMK